MIPSFDREQPSRCLKTVIRPPGRVLAVDTSAQSLDNRRRCPHRDRRAAPHRRGCVVRAPARATVPVFPSLPAGASADATAEAETLGDRRTVPGAEGTAPVVWRNWAHHRGHGESDYG